MSTTTVVDARKTPTAGMSVVLFLEKPEQAFCVVGSCIALTLYHPRTGHGALAHIVLPRSSDRTGPPGKYADTAIPYMVEALGKKGANCAGLVAKLSGGASMFGTSGPIKIGEQNAEAVTQLLKDLKIPIRGTHLAGPKGRRVTFNTQTGDVTVEVVGQPAETL